MTKEDFIKVLRYDRMVLDYKSFTPEERWSISQARSISMNNPFDRFHKETRTNWISQNTLDKCIEILELCTPKK